MQSFFSRLLKSPLASKRLISQLTQRGDGRLSSMLNRLGVQRLLGLFRIKDTQNQRGISSTPVLSADKSKLSLDLLNFWLHKARIYYHSVNR